MSLKGSFYIKWLAALTLISVLVYWPSLSGPFLFDDFPNLAPLLNYNAGIASASEVVFGGTSSFLGRPVAMATFLIGSESYPHDPWIFKLINLFIHLLNGVLVFFLVRTLATVTGLSQKRVEWLAVFSSACWMLHPFLMSSVLLVVQRMTLLMTFFALASMLSYLKASMEWPNRKAFFLIFLYILFGILSVLSKENGVLIPVYLLAIEATLMSKYRRDELSGFSLKRYLVIGPALLVVCALLYKIPSFLNGYAARDFTVVERLMTEARIIFEYAYNIFVPRLEGGGIFHDNYLVSTSLIEPITTLLAILGVSTLLVSAIYLRNKKPVYSMAVLFFLTGHLIESTVVPLELYFEHRNYLPSIGLLFGGGYLALSKIKKANIVGLFMVLYVLLLGGMSHLNANVWGSLGGIARVWAAENPDSTRAQMLLARYYTEAQRYDLANTALSNAIKLSPADIPLQFELIVNKCLWKQEVTKQSIDNAVEIVSKGSYSHGISNGLTVMVQMLAHNACKGLTSERLLELIDAALANKVMKNIASRQNLLFQKGEIKLFQGNYKEAMDAYNKVHELSPNPDLYVQQVRVSIALGKLSQAKHYLSLLKAFEANNTGFKKSYKEIILELNFLLEGAKNG